MYYYSVRVSTFLLAVCIALLSPEARAEIKPVKTVILTEGSIPPVHALYACIHELDNKPFSDAQIKDCAERIAANYFIRDVKTHTKEMDDIWNVEFVVRGDSLTVDELTLDTFDKQEAALQRLFSLSSDNLRLRGIFRVEAEISTYEVIRQFYRARGQSVGVIPRVNLDYKRGKASVKLVVVPGPAIPSQPLVPPYGDGCSDRTMYTSWLSTDDGVPIELVESGLALRSPFACFSEERAQHDKTYLANLPFLTEHLVQYSGAIGDRRIEYKLKAKPLKVQRIDLLGFGDVPAHLENGDPSPTRNLSLRSGDVFSSSAKNKAIEQLKKEFSRDGYWTEITEREELIGTDALKITFSVLVFPLQTVIVDGHELK